MRPPGGDGEKETPSETGGRRDSDGRDEIRAYLARERTGARRVWEETGLPRLVRVWEETTIHTSLGEGVGARTLHTRAWRHCVGERLVRGVGAQRARARAARLRTASSPATGAAPPQY